jgi:hypothetical protein
MRGEEKKGGVRGREISEVVESGREDQVYWFDLPTFNFHFNAQLQPLHPDLFTSSVPPLSVLLINSIKYSNRSDSLLPAICPVNSRRFGL